MDDEHDFRTRAAIIEGVVRLTVWTIILLSVAGLVIKFG